MNDQHLSEHDRIANNAQALETFNLRLSAVEQKLNPQMQTVINTDQGNYCFAFEPNTTPIDDSAQVALLTAGFTAFEEGEKFYRNLTSKTVIVTITIKNTDDDFSMDVKVAGKVVTTISKGKTVTITVEVPAGKSIKADKQGEYRVDSVN